MTQELTLLILQTYMVMANQKKFLAKLWKSPHLVVMIFTFNQKPEFLRMNRKTTRQLAMIFQKNISLKVLMAFFLA